MPNLHLPFLLKAGFTEKHKVVNLFLLINHQKIITVSHQGDIIIWQIKDNVDSMESKLYLTPSLTHQAGPLTALTMIIKPLQFYTEGILTCLVTVHRDNRIRIWNLEDGRCFSVSQHGIFKTEAEIIQIQILEMLNSDSRLLFCIGKDKKLMIVDIWSNELVKSVEVSNSNLICFKLDPEHSTIHFLNSNYEYLIWDIESYYKEDINNYTNFIVNMQEKKGDHLKNTKESLKHKIGLSGGNQDLPLNFISDIECSFFFVLFADRILIYKNDEVVFEKEKVKSYITLNFVNQNSLQEFYLVTVKNTKYLLIMTITGNITAVSLKDITHLWDLQENAKEELNFNHEDFSFFKNISSNSAYLTIKSVNLIYLKDDDILNHILSKPHIHNKLSAFDGTTNTLLLYNPLEKTITLFDCELELQKVKRKVKLLDIPKSQKIQKSNSNRPLHHKTSLVLSSGRKKLSLIANDDDEMEKIDEDSEQKLSDPSKFDSMTYKTMLGYLKHGLKETKKVTVNEFLNGLFSPIFKEKMLKNLNFHNFSNGKLIDNKIHEEKVTFNFCSYVKSSHLVYFIGTDFGNVYMFPFLFNYSWSYYPYFVYRDPEQFADPIKNLFVFKNCLFIEQGEAKILTIELNFESESVETRVFFSKTPPNKEMESEYPGSIQEISVNKWLKSTIYLDSSVESIRKLKTLRFYDENNNQNAEKEANYSFFKANLMPVALILHSNNIVIYSVQKHQIELELKGNNSEILAIFLHPFLDEIMSFNTKGYLFIYNIPTGVLDRIVPIDNYNHLFNFNRFINENYAKFNINSCKKFLEIEEFQTSKYHFLIDYSLRFENYLLDYSIGRELFVKKQENMIKPVVSSNILIGSSVMNPLIEMEQNNNNNSPANSHQILSSINLNINKQQSENDNEGINIILNYEKKKQESLGYIIYERNGDFLPNLKKAEKENAFQIANLLEGKNAIVKSNNKDQGISLLTFDPHELNRTKERKNTNDLGYIVFFDAKLNVRNMKIMNENEAQFLNQPSYFSYLSLIFPWGIDKEFDSKILTKIFYKMPVFQMLQGVQGAGESFTFMTNNKEKWAVSDYYSTLHTIALLYFITSFEEKELKNFTNYFLKIIEAFSKKKRTHDKLNPCINLPLICKFFLDSDGELMTAAYNLLISSMKNKDIDFDFVLRNSLVLYKLTSNEKVRPENFSYSLVIWILMIGYTSVFYEKSRASAEDCIKDIVILTDIKNCIKNPNFICGSLKLILDASHLLKNYTKETMDFLDKLIYIYFIYYLSNEYQLQANKESMENKGNTTSNARMSMGASTTNIITLNDLKEIEKQRSDIRKTMKHIVSKAISAIGIIFIKDFLKILKEQILNTNPHVLYPTAIIDIIRNFLKSQNPKQVHKFLHTFVEVILKTLDPNNPNLRKVCHKPASQALHTIYKLYDMVSFHPTSQKFAIGTTENVIILYDLRTAVKWKVLEGHKGPISCMNFDNPGKYLASFSVGDSTLRIWKIGTTGFFSSILGMQGKHFKLFDIDKKKYLNEKLNSDLKFSLIWTEKSNHSTISLNLGEKCIDSYDIIE